MAKRKIKLTHEEQALKVWEQQQITAAMAQQRLDEAIKTYDEHKFELTPEDRQKVESQIFAQKQAIIGFLTQARLEYVKEVGDKVVMLDNELIEGINDEHSTNPER